MSNFYALDIETASNVAGKEYALECYRLPQGKARITSVAVSGPDSYFRQLDERSDNMSDIPALLKFLKGKEVFAHRAVFDIGWLIAQTDYRTLLDIKWRDSGLLAKWLVKGRKVHLFACISGRWARLCRARPGWTRCCAGRNCRC